MNNCSVFCVIMYLHIFDKIKLKLGLFFLQKIFYVYFPKII